jgi:SAM-dependent methyltransferase
VAAAAVTIRHALFTASVVLSELSEKASRAFLFLGVGLLSRADLKDVSRRSWSGFALSDAQARSGLTPAEEAIYWKVVKPGDRICIVGCGSGRDLLPFASAGFDVVGIEPSPAPLEMLRRLLRDDHLSATLIEGHVEDVAVPGLFDAVLFSTHCYSYIQGTASRVAVLRDLAAHLTPTGRIVLTYPRRRSDWDNRSMRLATLTGRLTRSDWRMEPFDALIRIDVPGERGAIVRHHVFSPEEIDREAGQAGLRVVEHGDPWATPYAVLGR